MPNTAGKNAIPATLAHPGAMHFWLAVLFTEAGAGICAAALTRVLEAVQHFAWGGSSTNILSAAQNASAWRHILVLLGSGFVTGAGQFVLRRLSTVMASTPRPQFGFTPGGSPPSALWAAHCSRW